MQPQDPNQSQPTDFPPQSPVGLSPYVVPPATANPSDTSIGYPADSVQPQPIAQQTADQTTPVIEPLAVPPELSSYASQSFVPKKKNKLFPIIVIGGILAVIAAGLMLFLPKDNSADAGMALNSRLGSLITLLETSQTKITDKTLAKVNAEARSVLLTDQVVLDPLLPKVDPKKIARLLTSPSDKDATESLKSSQINGRFNVDYTAVLVDKFEGVNTSVVDLSKKTTSPKLREQLKTLTSHLQTYYNQLQAINL